MRYRPERAPRTAAEAMHQTRLGTWTLRRELIRRVAQGLACDDAREMSLACGATIPGQVLHPRWLGSAWLHWLTLTVGIWAITQGLACGLVGEEVPDVARVGRYEAALLTGLLAAPVGIWKVCRRGLGIEHWRDRRRAGEPQPSETADLPWARLAFTVGMLVLIVLSHYFDYAPAGVSLAAFTSFYVDPSGSNLNAGSVAEASASVTSTNGDWGNATANRFTAASGTPFSGVNVGDYASVYLDAATVTTYVAQVTAVNASGTSIDLSTTIKYGTAPTNGATGRSCKIGGSWRDEIVLAATGLGATTVPQSTKVNIKAATYTVTASRAVNLSGTTTAPSWIAGYNTTPGDLDADTTNALSRPILSLNSTFVVTLQSAYGLVSSLSIDGNRNGAIVTIGNSASSWLSRVRLSNVNTSTSASALSAGSTAPTVAYLSGNTLSSATAAGVFAFSNGGALVVGLVASGGGTAGVTVTGGYLTGTQCIAINNTGDGVRATTGGLNVTSCTVSTASGDGIKWTGTPGAGSYLIGCLLRTCGGYGINNASGANTKNVFRACNAFYSCTSGNENGFGDAVALFGQTDSADPIVSASDLTPLGTSAAASQGYPGIVEGQAFNSYQDIGAVQRKAGGVSRARLVNG